MVVTFDEFVTLRLPALVRFAAVLTGDRELAQDVVQDALVKVHARWRHRRPDQPEWYVKKAITNEYLSWRRRTARRRALLAPNLGMLARPAVAEDPAGRSAERGALWGQLAQLPARQRAVLVLRYYEGLSDAQIAQVLDCTTGTVRGHHSRALARLRLQLTTPATTGEEQ